MTGVADKHEIEAKKFLEPGETILAMAVCQRPPTIERQPDGTAKVVAVSQMGESARLVVTERRFLALKTGGWRVRARRSSSISRFETWNRCSPRSAIHSCFSASRSS